MTRRKVKLALIENVLERRNTYKKRKQSVLRKTEELSTLCGIDACAIVYSSNDTEAQTWPTDDADVKAVLQRFKGLSKWEQSKYMVDKDDFTTQMIAKRREQLRKVEKENKEEELTMFMYNCINTGGIQAENNLSSNDLNNLSSIIERNLNAITRRLENLDVNDMTPNQQLQIQAQSNQPMFPIPDYQSQMQRLPYQNPMQTPTLILPQIQAQPSYQTLMETPNYLPQMQTPSYQSVMEALSSSLSQAQFNTEANQNLIDIPAFQPNMQNQSYQSQMEIPAYQPQMQTQPLQAFMHNPLYQPPQMQAQTYNPLMEAASSSSQPQLPNTLFQTALDPPPYRPQMPPPALAAANTEEMPALDLPPYRPQMPPPALAAANTEEMPALDLPPYRPQMPPPALAAANTEEMPALDPPPYRPQLPPPALAAANTEEMPTLLNDGNATNLNADSTSTQWIMDMLLDNDFDPVLPGSFDFHH